MRTEVSSYHEATAKASALKEIGVEEIYLSKGELPWHLVTRCGEGGTHRFDIATDVWFYATDPKTGLNFRWSFDIEPSGANGKSCYDIDVSGCQAVLKKLSGEARISFRNYLSECASKVFEQGSSYQKVADRQFHDAAILRDIAKIE